MVGLLRPRSILLISDWAMPECPASSFWLQRSECRPAVLARRPGRRAILGLWPDGAADVFHEQDKVQVVGWAVLEFRHQVKVEFLGLG
jgi:hypothetical protein